jgi:hypothetical protein
MWDSFLLARVSNRRMHISHGHVGRVTSWQSCRAWSDNLENDDEPKSSLWNQNLKVADLERDGLAARV